MRTLIGHVSVFEVSFSLRSSQIMFVLHFVFQEGCIGYNFQFIFVEIPDVIKLVLRGTFYFFTENKPTVF